jgi:hypothetical protein
LVKPSRHVTDFLVTAERADHERRAAVAGVLQIWKELRKSSDDQLRLLDELGQALWTLKGRNGALLRSRSDALQLYQELRAELTPEERDAFLRGLLADVKVIADGGRFELRRILSSYFEASAESTKERMGVISRAAVRGTDSEVDGPQPNQDRAHRTRHEGSDPTNRSMVVHCVVRGSKKTGSTSGED